MLCLRAYHPVVQCTLSLVESVATIDPPCLSLGKHIGDDEEVKEQQDVFSLSLFHKNTPIAVFKYYSYSPLLLVGS